MCPISNISNLSIMNDLYVKYIGGLNRGAGGLVLCIFDFNCNFDVVQSNLNISINRKLRICVDTMNLLVNHFTCLFAIFPKSGSRIKI